MSYFPRFEILPRGGGIVCRAFFIWAIAVAATIFAASAANAAILIAIDKSTQRMTVTVDGIKKYTWPVSTGRAGYATPSGSFWAFRMEKDYHSKEWDDAPMPNTIFFTPEGHAIHGTYQQSHLGSPASHGCVRLSLQNAATLFKLVQAQGMWSTRVVITGPTPMLPRPPARIARKPASAQVASTAFGSWLNENGASVR
jgi:lipoprotein-anchoring transpeptidase ErfK/SrfK